MGIGGPPESGFYTGGGLSAEVPHLYPVALDGRPYLLDMKAADMAHSTRSFYRQSIQLLRDQSDASNLPGEQSISPEELWRRGMDDWSHGAGQVHYDRAQSDPARFRQSKGVYVWERWEVSLLPDTGQKRSSANTNLNLAVAGTRLYLVDGTALVYTPDLTAFTTVTGTPGVAAVAIATDGYTVWTAHTASGIYSTNRTLGAASQYTTGNCTLVAYLKGRLMAAYQIGRAHV